MAMLNLVSTECLNLFLAFTFTKTCVEKTVVNLLNLGILAGSVAVKLPQIIKILISRSVAGLSESAFVLELLATVTSCLYHVLLEHPFSAWGEMFLISVQCAAQCVLFWAFSREVSLPSRIAGSAVLVGVSRLVLTRGVPAEYIYILGACPIVLSIWSRLPQIVLNFKQGHTGQLALITFALSGLGNLARVFTTIKQTPDDTVSLVSMVVSAVLNFTLVFQIVAYWKVTQKVTGGKTGGSSTRAPSKRIASANNKSA